LGSDYFTKKVVSIIKNLNNFTATDESSPVQICMCMQHNVSVQEGSAAVICTLYSEGHRRSMKVALLRGGTFQI